MTGYLAEMRKLVGHRTVMQCAASIICVNEEDRILLGRRSDNHKWGFFPSAALKWNIHKESFLSGMDKIDELSLKVSAGQTGNDSIGYFLSQAALVSTTGSLMYGSQPVVYLPARIDSPDLTWETTTMYNAGLTGSFFNSRLRFSLEAYTSHTDDLLLTVKVPMVSMLPLQRTTCCCSGCPCVTVCLRILPVLPRA